MKAGYWVLLLERKQSKRKQKKNKGDISPWPLLKFHIKIRKEKLLAALLYSLRKRSILDCLQRVGRITVFKGRTPRIKQGFFNLGKL